MGTIETALPACPVVSGSGLAGNKTDLETGLYDVLRAGAAGLAAGRVTAKLTWRRACRRIQSCLPRTLSVDELVDRDAVIGHVAQRKTFLAQQDQANRRWWKTSRKEASMIGRLMSQKLAQLGMDYIFSLDGDKVRRFVKFEAVEISPDQYRFKVNSRKLPRGVNEVEMTKEEVIKGLECTLGKTVQYHLSEAGLWFMVDRQSGLRNIPRYVAYADVANLITSKDGPLVVALGMGQNRTPIKINFQHETTAHFLVGGTTGAGKTNAVHTIICTLLKQRPEEIKLILIDLKGIEFPQYDGVPHLARPVVTDPAMVLPLVKGLWENVQDRMVLLRQERGVNHIREYNLRRKPAERLPYIVVVFDELAIVMLDRTLKHKAEIESFLARIASVGRASGIHLVLATQRPDKNVLTPLITANFPGRIGLACASVYDSMTIIGNGSACFEEAVPPGRAILAYSRHRTPFQVCFLKDDLRRSIIDDAEGGRFGNRRMTHDVTIQELVRYALDNFSGNFAYRKLWHQYRDRGISRMEIEELGRIYRLERFYMDDGEYILESSGKRQAVMIIKVIGAQSPETVQLPEPTLHIPADIDDDDAEYNQFKQRVLSEVGG